ncbi:MAG: acetylglutamate kinase [Candidatus Sumerlaeota bacterium]|nr:acetylglutamate kinase [Candidatus Sumerlaeota bacterium]
MTERMPINLRELTLKDLIERADTIIEALPYISAFRGQTIVVKYGGSAMLEPSLKEAVIQDLALMELVGMKVVLVHGGGPAIDEHLNRLKIEPVKIEGQRVTTAETLEVVGMVLSHLNREIVGRLNRSGVTAVGLTGKDARLIEARKLIKKRADGTPGTDLGFVGEVAKVNPRIINLLQEDNIIPVLMPIGYNFEEGQAYNINADTVAAAVAAEMKAAKLVLLTEAPGILRDRNDLKSVIGQIKREEVDNLINTGVIQGGMIPKIRACLRALDKGVGKTHILDGRLPHCLLLELLTDKGIGSLIY